MMQVNRWILILVAGAPGIIKNITLRFILASSWCVGWDELTEACILNDIFLWFPRHAPDDFQSFLTMLLRILHDSKISISNEFRLLVVTVSLLFHLLPHRNFQQYRKLWWIFFYWWHCMVNKRIKRAAWTIEHN